MLEINNLVKTFAEEDSYKLNVDNLKLDSGEKLLLTGASGTGKSTLLNLIAGLDTPTSGNIIFENAKISSLTETQRDAWRAQNLGFVFQDFHLFEELSILDNVIQPFQFYANKVNKRDIKCQAKEMLDFLEIGYKNKSAAKLSRGEKQRLAIARVLIKRPKLILADEPTASLDIENAEKIYQILFDACAKDKVILLMATHDKSKQDLFDKQLNLGR